MYLLSMGSVHPAQMRLEREFLRAVMCSYAGSLVAMRPLELSGEKSRTGERALGGERLRRRSRRSRPTRRSSGEAVRSELESLRPGPAGVISDMRSCIRESKASLLREPPPLPPCLRVARDGCRERLDVVDCEDDCVDCVDCEAFESARSNPESDGLRRKRLSLRSRSGLRRTSFLRSGLVRLGPYAEIRKSSSSASSSSSSFGESGGG